MEHLKNPGVILGVVDLVVIGGVVLHFNREITAIKADVAEIKKLVLTMSNKIIMTEKGVAPREQAVASLQEHIKRVEDRVTDIQSREATLAESTGSTMEELVGVLVEHNIDVGDLEYTVRGEAPPRRPRNRQSRDGKQRNWAGNASNHQENEHWNRSDRREDEHRYPQQTQRPALIPTRVPQPTSSTRDIDSGIEDVIGDFRGTSNTTRINPT